MADQLNSAQPSWRKPIGVLALLLGLTGYALGVAALGGTIGALPVLVQVPVYIALGTLWLLPMRRFLIWTETGRWG